MTGDADARPLHHWFRDGLAVSPDGPALAIYDRYLTYRELDELAEQYAARLRDGGVRRLGVLAAKSEEAYAAVLGSLYAGAAYVPLGPEVPVQRNIAIALAAGVDGLVVDQAGAPQASELIAATGPRAVVAPALDLAPAPRRPENRPEPRADSDLAYVLFTSGSTGQPKGVPISHANLSAFIASSLHRYRFGPDDRFSQIFELTFDLAAFDMFMAWAAGACVCVMSRLNALDPVRSARRYGLTVWHATPSLVRAVRAADRVPAAGLPGIRYSVFCGEPLPVDLAGYWREAAPNSVIDNIYGPTELTIACTAYRIESADLACYDTVPIGRPNDGMAYILLGSSGEVRADVGELCMRGSQMFCGYLDPANDEGRFVTVDGQHWYRTGDRVRLDAQAGLIHLGRLDDQVKLHGYRVELGEVEQAIRLAAGAGADAFALVLDEPEQALAAFVLTEHPADPVRLAESLARTLPSYMVPRHLWPISQAPLSRHGKIDRAALHAEALRRLRQPEGRTGPICLR